MKNIIITIAVVTATVLTSGCGKAHLEVKEIPHVERELSFPDKVHKSVADAVAEQSMDWEIYRSRLRRELPSQAALTHSMSDAASQRANRRLEAYTSTVVRHFKGSFKVGLMLEFTTPELRELYDLLESPVHERDYLHPLMERHEKVLDKAHTEKGQPDLERVNYLIKISA